MSPKHGKRMYCNMTQIQTFKPVLHVHTCTGESSVFFCVDMWLLKILQNLLLTKNDLSEIKKNVRL